MAKKPSAKEKAKPTKEQQKPNAKAKGDDAKASAAEKPAAKKAAKAEKAAVGGEAAAGGEAEQRVRGGKPVGIREELQEIEEVGAFRVWLREAVRQTPSWLVSMVVHMVILLVLAILTVPQKAMDDLRSLVVAPESDMEELEELEDEEIEDLDLTTTDITQIETEVQPEEPEVSPVDDMEAAPVKVELDDFGLDKAPRNDLLASVGAYTGGGLSGRGQGQRGAMVGRYGGSEASEKAVAAALKWLAEHQFPDGGWSFAHHLAPRCQGKCRNPGNLAEARIGATAMGLLPFLGAGQTHKAGNYKKTVKNGLYFLVNHMKISPKGGELYEEGGRMYSHGLASIALCEAYAMTHDKGLFTPAQQAVNFICYAQDPVGGGWRYQPRQPGDTSVVGWQIMALKSGHMAYLTVPPVVVKKSFKYLDTVQAGGGSYYGYTDPGKGQATTAIGLLCRMYLGWKKDNPALERGVKQISQWGPSGNYYYNYYATQVMRHWGGDEWKKWNGVMRDKLVNSQAKQGHETGSWFSGGDHGAERGGRLYCTSMATMVLEVYYRHLPIYRKQSTEEEFPLD